MTQTKDDMIYTERMKKLLQTLELGCENLSFEKPPEDSQVKDLKASRSVLDEMRKLIENRHKINQYIWFHADLVETIEGLDSFIQEIKKDKLKNYYKNRNKRVSNYATGMAG